MQKHHQMEDLIKLIETWFGSAAFIIFPLFWGSVFFSIVFFLIVLEINWVYVLGVNSELIWGPLQFAELRAH